jgi:uncharacterized protein
MLDFIPWSALLGGMLLGLSSALLMLFNGRVAGISGIVSGLINPQKDDYLWRFMFVIGMVISAYLIAPFGFSLPELGDMNLLVVVVGGLCVGLGTRVGCGCTSGHGIVGVGRLSVRSITATFTFLIAGMLMVYIRQIFGVL